MDLYTLGFYLCLIGSVVSGYLAYKSDKDYKMYELSEEETYMAPKLKIAGSISAVILLIGAVVSFFAYSEFFSLGCFLVCAIADGIGFYLTYVKRYYINDWVEPENKEQTEDANSSEEKTE